MIKHLVRFDKCVHHASLRTTLWMVVFLKDYGPWKKDEKVMELDFDFFNGVIRSHDMGMEKECNIDIVIFEE